MGLAPLHWPVQRGVKGIRVQRVSIRETVLQQMRDVAAQQKKTLAPLGDSLELADTGLDSLCLALLVASLDDRLGLDPFSRDPPFPVTVGQFIALYENAG